jgi:aromatic ring-cleaving dioxygenase
MNLEVNDIESYHAHVYFDADSREPANALREAVLAGFPTVTMGRWHEKNVGPHPRWSYQIAFPPALFGDLTAWLMLHRRGCTIFLHPNTGNGLEDHRDHPTWMGEMIPLNLAMFQKD